MAGVREEQLRQMLEQLHTELERADTIDDRSRELLRGVLGDIEDLLERKQKRGTPPESIVARLRAGDPDGNATARPATSTTSPLSSGYPTRTDGSASVVASTRSSVCGDASVPIVSSKCRSSPPRRSSRRSANVVAMPSAATARLNAATAGT